MDDESGGSKSRIRESGSRDWRPGQGSLGVGVLVARALRNHNVWLVLMYVAVILLMARAYA